jgi:hypothetical protein
MPIERHAPTFGDEHNDPSGFDVTLRVGCSHTSHHRNRRGRRSTQKKPRRAGRIRSEKSTCGDHEWNLSDSAAGLYASEPSNKKPRGAVRGEVGRSARVAEMATGETLHRPVGVVHMVPRRGANGVGSNAGPIFLPTLARATRMSRLSAGPRMNAGVRRRNNWRCRRRSRLNRSMDGATNSWNWPGATCCGKSYTQ